MKQNIKIKKVELTLFEIELLNILEDRGGIGIKYSPGQKGKHIRFGIKIFDNLGNVGCLLYTSPSPRDRTRSRMPSSA